MPPPSAVWEVSSYRSQQGRPDLQWGGGGGTPSAGRASSGRLGISSEQVKGICAQIDSIFMPGGKALTLQLEYFRLDIRKNLLIGNSPAKDPEGLAFP